MSTAAISSYEVSYALTPVLFFVGGLTLLLTGRRNRRTVTPVTKTTAAEPDARRNKRGRNQVAFGVLLLVMGVVGTPSVAAGLRGLDRTIAMPASVLGLQRDAELSRKGAAMLSSYQGDHDDAEVAVYAKDDQPAVTVIAMTGRFMEPAQAIDDLRDSFEKDQGLTLGDGEVEAAGTLGGNVRCWSPTIKGTVLGLCLLADRGSIVMVLDADATSPSQAAERATTIREAVVS